MSTHVETWRVSLGGCLVSIQSESHLGVFIQHAEEISGQTSFRLHNHLLWLDNQNWFPWGVSILTWIFLLAAAHLLRRGVRDQAGEVFDRLPLSRVEVNVVQGDAMGGGEDRKQVSCYYPPNISTGTIEPPWTKNCGGYSSSILVIHILLSGGLKKA